MQIVLNRWFNLPFLGRDVFADLMRAKVEHDKRFGFRFTSSTNIPRALSILSGVLREPVEMAKSCFICDSPLPEEGESGPLVLNSERTLCPGCENSSDAFELYLMKFAKLMEAA